MNSLARSSYSKGLPVPKAEEENDQQQHKEDDCHAGNEPGNKLHAHSFLNTNQRFSVECNDYSRSGHFFSHIAFLLNVISVRTRAAFIIAALSEGVSQRNHLEKPVHDFHRRRKSVDMAVEPLCQPKRLYIFFGYIERLFSVREAKRCCHCMSGSTFPAYSRLEPDDYRTRSLST
jgi:hypothetical protein